MYALKDFGCIYLPYWPRSG